MELNGKGADEAAVGQFGLDARDVSGLVARKAEQVAGKRAYI